MVPSRIEAVQHGERSKNDTVMYSSQNLHSAPVEGGTNGEKCNEEAETSHTKTALSHHALQQQRLQERRPEETPDVAFNSITSRPSFYQRFRVIFHLVVWLFFTASVLFQSR